MSDLSSLAPIAPRSAAEAPPQSLRDITDNLAAIALVRRRHAERLQVVDELLADDAHVAVRWARERMRDIASLLSDPMLALEAVLPLSRMLRDLNEASELLAGGARVRALGPGRDPYTCFGEVLLHELAPATDGRLLRAVTHRPPGAPDVAPGALPVGLVSTGA